MLKRRETLGSTGIGQNIAIPHCRALAVNRLRVAFGRKLDGIDFNAIDSKPVHYFFLIVAPPLEVSNQYLPVLGKIAQFAKEPDVPAKLAMIATPKEFLKLLEDIPGRKREALGFLPRDQPSEVAHSPNLSDGCPTSVVVSMRRCSYRCRVSRQRLTRQRLTPTRWSPAASSSHHTPPDSPPAPR